ncbi:MAG TPA: biosynthetic-type acetolactate synthase large subunit [Nitrospiria bacterium]
MKMNGAQIFVESLKKEGVEVIFGLPGGVVLKIFDVLYDYKEPKVVLTRHEQGAAHMAEGYAKATGKPGVVLVTSGPGMTNIVTGLADAYMDSVPLVVFTGQVSTSLIGNDAFQEADNVGISRPCTKYNFLVKDVNDLAQTIKEAFYIASTGRPGPVVVDIPKDVSMNMAEFNYPEKVYIRGYSPTIKGHKGQIKQAADAILKARRPILYVGGGTVFSNAFDELRTFAELTHIPVDMTLMALGAFPASHPQSLGMLGMHGSYASNMAIHHSDLIIAAGSRFDDRVTGKVSDFAPYAKIVHIDIDPTSIQKIMNVDVPIVGDVKYVLKELAGYLETSVNGKRKEELKPWWNQIEEWKTAHPLAYKQEKDGLIKPQYLIDRLCRLTAKEDPIVATDVGQHQMWAAQFFKLESPRTWLTSGGLGTMGFGFPAALGAQMAYPDRLVLGIVGDGSFQMNLQELATAMDYKLPVKVVIVNNGFHGMVRQWQDFFYKGRYSASRLGKFPDYVKLAEAYSAVGLRATKPGEVDGIIQKALKADGPVLVDVHVDPLENCLPMIPAGGANHEMILETPSDSSGKGKDKAGEGEKEGILTA